MDRRSVQLRETAQLVDFSSKNTLGNLVARLELVSKHLLSVLGGLLVPEPDLGRMLSGWMPSLSFGKSSEKKESDSSPVSDAACPTKPGRFDELEEIFIADKENTHQVRHRTTCTGSSLALWVKCSFQEYFMLELFLQLWHDRAWALVQQTPGSATSDRPAGSDAQDGESSQGSLSTPEASAEDQGSPDKEALGKLADSLLQGVNSLAKRI